MKRLLLILSALFWMPVADGNLALAGTEKAESVCEELVHACVVPQVRHQRAATPTLVRSVAQLPFSISSIADGRAYLPTPCRYLRHRCLLI